MDGKGQLALGYAAIAAKRSDSGETRPPNLPRMTLTSRLMPDATLRMPGILKPATAAMHRSRVIILSQILIRNLSKPAQHLPAVELAQFEIGGAAKRNGAGVTQYLPLPLRGLYCGRWTGAVDGFTGRKAAVGLIKSQCHEMNDFGH
jgi:hypothetical protein